MADMADIDQVEEAWDELAAGDRRRRADPGHLHELVRRPQGLRRPPRRRRLHVVQRPGRADLGAGPRAGPGRPGPVLPRPASRAATPASSSGYGADDMRVWNPRLALGGLDRPRGQGVHAAAVEGPLLGPPALPARARRRLPRRAPRRDRRWCTPSAPTRSWSWATWSGSTDAIIRAVAAAPAGSVIGVATEIHLVNRLDDESPDKTVVCLDPLVCPAPPCRGSTRPTWPGSSRAW